MSTLPRQHPLTVTVDDFVITTQLLERKCELHYELTLKRPRVGEPWEIAVVDGNWIMRDLPSSNPRYYSALWRSNQDLTLELIAYIANDDASFQRLQDAANSAADKLIWQS